MGTISMKIFHLEKREVENKSQTKTNMKSLQAKGRIHMSEVLVPDEPDKVEEVHKRTLKHWQKQKMPKYD